MLRRIYALFIFSALFSALSLNADESLTYVVTASRESEDVMDSPAKVSVITSEDIQASGKTSLVHILEDVAGVSFRSFSGEAQAQVSMRGFGENSYGRVLVLVDGRKLNNPDMAGVNWQSIPLSSIERIEVLDGPSSVLYGSGAVGGVINIITRESASGVTAGATLSFGSFDTRRVQVNGGLGGDSAGFLVSADYFQTSGYRDRSASENTNVLINGFVDIGDKLTLKPGFTFADIAYQMPGSLSKSQFEDDPTQAVNQKDDGTEKNFGGSLLSVLTATDSLSFELPLSYMFKDRKAEMVSFMNPSFGTPESHTSTEQHQGEAKPKITVALDTMIGPMNLTGGIDLGGTASRVKNFEEEKRLTLTSDNSFEQISVAPYMSGSLKLPAFIEVNLGVRYEKNNLTTRNESTDIEYEKESHGFAYDFSINYHPAENVSAYTKFNTLYRFPFLDEILTYGTFLEDLEPETGYNVELGSKYHFNTIFSVFANVYYMMMIDEVAYNPISYKNENLDATRRLGGSLSLLLTPVKFVEINGNISYVDTSFEEGDNKGNNIPLVPALTANSSLIFKLPQGVSLGGDVSYTGESYAGGDTANISDKIPAYTLFGLSAGCTPPQLGGKLSVNGRVDNLLDVSYAPFVHWSGYYPATGRSFTVSAAYTY